MSLDIRDVVYYFRGLIAGKTQIPYDKIVHIYQKGTKPTGIYATFDILRISDTNTYLSNKRFDSESGEVSYETFKTLDIQISVRNGSPSNTDNQLEVQNLANRLHKAFAEDSTLAYLKDNISGVVLTVDSIRMFGDVSPTATGKVALFDLSIAVPDITKEYVGGIRDVQIQGTLIDGSTEIDMGFETGESSPSSVLFTVVSADPAIRVDLEPYTKTIEGRGLATIMSEDITLPEGYSFDIQLRQLKGDKSILSFLGIPITLTFVTQGNESRMRVDMPDGDYTTTPINLAIPTSINFKVNDEVEIVNGAYSLPLSFAYGSLSTNIQLDFEGKQPTSNAVLNFNN